jgi:PAS domain S-box-containing protein
MARRVKRAGGWLRDCVRAIAEWPCRHELARLRDQRRRFAALLDAVADVVVLTGPNGRLRLANRTAAELLQRLTGRSIDELIGKAVPEFHLPADLERTLIDTTARVREMRAPVCTEFAIPQAGGGFRWYEHKASPILRYGELAGQIIIGRDIDDRKRAQRRLQLLSKVSALVGNLDIDALLTAVAKLSIPELADWSAVDVRDDRAVRRTYVAHRDAGRASLANELQQFRPWQDEPAWQELAAGHSLFFPDITDELLRTRTIGREHYDVIRRMGLRSAIAVPLRVRDETVAVMSFGTAESGRRFTEEDLTLAEELAQRAAVVLERARLDHELRLSYARFRAALGTGRTAVFEQDRELRYRWHHNYALGVDATGKRHEDIFPPQDAARLTAIKQRVLDTGDSAREELRLTINGERYDVVLAIDPVRDDNGEIVGIIGAGTDITEEKRVQQELAQAVTFREQLMGILGHDLRNPLSAINVATGSLRKRSDLAEPARQHVERIGRAASRMSEMIRTILDFTQVRFHGTLPVAPRPTNLAEVAHAIVDEARAAEPARVIELVVDGDLDGVWDPARLGEVLSNLIGNALAHGAADQPVRVTVDVEGGEVCLRVHNGGPAIPPDRAAALFDPFRRGVAGEAAARTRGLGLGLYIVRQIVLAHRGTIGVTSTAGDGTTFTVRLPRGVSPAAALAATHH